MKIAVCMKSVLNGELEPEASGSIRRTDKNSSVNPSDLCAFGAALSLGGEVSVFTMGPEHTAGALLTEMARLGADRLLLISDKLYAGSDSFVTAKILCRALTLTGPFDLVLCGERAIDGETGQVPGELSALLDVPYATSVASVRMEDGRLLCGCLTEDGMDTLRLPVPAVLGISCGIEGIARPITPSLKTLRRAQHMRAERLDNGALGFSPEEVGTAGSPTCVRGTHTLELTRRCVFPGRPEDGAREVMSSVLAARRQVAV